MFDLRYYQREAVSAVYREWDSVQSTAIIAATGTGKCLGKGTPILMFDGSIKPVECVEFGDQLMGPDSAPRTVLSVCQGSEHLYRVEPVKGDPYIVNESHILSLKLTPRRKGMLHKIVNISVKDYLSESKQFKHLAKGYRVGVDWPESPVPIDPYYLGIWLGDGRTDSTAVSKPDDEIRDAVQATAEEWGLRFVKYKQEGRCDSYAAVCERGHKNNGLKDALRELGLLGTKHVPHVYKANSRNVRLEILAGLMDTDGCVSSGCFDYISKDEPLANDVAFLCRSLGFAAYVTPVEKGCQTGAWGLYYRVSISGDCSIIPTRILRKQANARRQVKSVLVTGISVEPIGVGDYYGFTIDGDGLFMLGDFTVTHNTEIYLSVATEMPGRVLIVAHRDYLLTQPIARLAKHGYSDVAVEKAEQRSEGGVLKSKIVFASVQSLSRQARLDTFDPFAFDVVIIDEAHRAVAKSYRTIIDHFKRNPRLRMLLLTATPKRKDGVALANVCDSVAYTYGPKTAIQEGWIVPLRFYRRQVADLDFSTVKLKGSDLDQEQIERLMMEEKPLHEVCASLAEDQGPTLIFCPGVMVARAYCSLMNERYRRNRAAVLWADSETDERELVGKKLANGDLDYLFQVDLATEGYDVPELVRVVWAAPTASLVRFTQGTGRVFRTHGSLRGVLQGEREDAESRRLQIQQSPKPLGMVVTYYPQNCKHQLCEPNDILGGDDLPPEIKSYAKQIQEATAAQANGSDPDEDVETAQAVVSLRSLLEKRREKIRAEARVADTEYDAFGGSRNRAAGNDAREHKAAAKAVSSDWPRKEGTKMISKPMKGWFKYHGCPQIDELDITAWQSFVVRQLVEKKIAPMETALSYGKDQALAILRKHENKVSNEAIPE